MLSSLLSCAEKIIEKCKQLYNKRIINGNLFVSLKKKDCKDTQNAERIFLKVLVDLTESRSSAIPLASFDGYTAEYISDM